MTLHPYFDGTRRRLTSFLDEFLSRKGRELASVKPWGRDITERLASFTRRGKMIRGGLVCLGSEMAGHRPSKDAVKAGAALELIQSALLIHDDIMDKDTLRRGEPSFHQQYFLLGRREGLSDPAHFGESMGICAGEIAIFLAFEVLSTLSSPRARAAGAMELVARELAVVGLGQMRDLHAGSSVLRLTEKEIVALYKQKTARYSFSLPLALGCLLAGGSSGLRSKLEKCGELLGLIFQLKDDEIGLFGDEAETGKPVGSDIRQGKKTLFHHLLMERASAGERRALASIFGNPKATKADIAFVRRLADRRGVREAVGSRIEGYRKKAEVCLQNLPVERRLKEILRSLLEYSLGRRK